MQVNIQSAQDLFFLPLQYEIPIYQRPYVWDEERQWQPLWEDVERTAEDILDPPSQGSADHFMGAIVVQAASTLGTLSKWLVIDGQQRLTTLQILIDAAQLALSASGPDASGPSQQLHTLVENQDFHYDQQNAPNLRFKVWPTAGDQTAFKTAMTRVQLRLQSDEPRLLEAHRFFEQQARDWLDRDDHELGTRANALAIALSHRIKLVAIQLDGHENPNVIFETLNARGTPLLDWDLAKNFLLHRSELEGLESQAIYQRYFKPLEVEEWWREDSTRGRVYRPRIDLFLYNWLILRTKRPVDAEKVFNAFNQYAIDKDVSALANDLLSTAGHYRAIQLNRGSMAWKEFLPKWHILEAGVTMPLLLWLKEQEVDGQLPQEELKRCLAALESFFVRRAVCRIAQRGLNRLFPQLLARLKTDSGTPADTVIGFLRSQPAGLAEWPSDRSFGEHLMAGKMYRQLTRRRTRLVLEGIETELAGRGNAVIKQHQSLFIEHLMPQSYLPHYPLTSTTLDDEETPQQQRDRLIHTLGNLSLTTSKMGIAMSNGPWDKKTPQLAKSALALNHDVLAHSGESWTDQDIIKRGERVADLAIKIWPPPHKI